MTKTKKLLTALILSAIIISSSGCEFPENTPVIGSEAEVSASSESSSSLPESSSGAEITVVPESSEPEETVEAEPVLEPVFQLSSQSVERGGYFIIKAGTVNGKYG